MMKDDLIELKIKDIESQLRDLRREVLAKKKKPSRKRVGSFAGLRGIWKEKVHFTEEGIKAAKIRVKEIPE